jgi:hypothetical protein
VTIVTLSVAEVALAAGVGVRRQCSAILNRRSSAHGDRGAADWQLHIEGALAEFAVAKHLGLYWSGAHDDLRADDVGQYQVRSTKYADGMLVLHPPDPDERPFILVTGRNGEYALRGWVLGREGKRDEWWGDRWNTGRPAFFVPGEALHPMAALPPVGRRS